LTATYVTLAFPRTTSSKEISTVAEANARKRLSIEVTKADISRMCQQAGAEEETEVNKFFIPKI